MRIRLTDAEKAALMKYLQSSEDCEKLSEHEWVADVYDLETPFSLDLVFKKDSIFADGAEYLSYDEEMDGYYLSGAIDSPLKVKELLRSAGALGE